MTCNPGGESARLAALHRYQVLDTAPEEAFDRITRLAKTVLQMPFCMVSLVDRDRNWFKSKQNVPVDEDTREGSFCGHTIESDEPFIVHDARADPRFAGNPAVKDAPHIRFYLGVPLRTREGYNIGTLCTLDTEVREVSAEQVQVLKDLARLVVDELELRLVAAIDSLTGAMTRRQFLEEATRDFARAKRHQQPLSCIVLDMDWFKSINDTYGHSVGDIALQHVVALCKVTMRAFDYVGRMGGEEFVVLLPETSAEAAFEVAEHLRQALAAAPVRLSTGEIAVTASFGVASNASNVTGILDLIRNADTAMYAAKLAGRNRTVTYAAELEKSAGGRDALRLSAA